LLESSKEILDQMPRPVQIFIVGAFGCSVGFWRNDDTLAGLL
jgi:hypothetical protein